mgnify:CR=1 FL=1
MIGLGMNRTLGAGGISLEFAAPDWLDEQWKFGEEVRYNRYNWVFDGCLS